MRECVLFIFSDFKILKALLTILTAVTEYLTSLPLKEVKNLVSSPHLFNSNLINQKIVLWATG